MHTRESRRLHPEEHEKKEIRRGVKREELARGFKLVRKTSAALSTRRKREKKIRDANIKKRSSPHRLIIARLLFSRPQSADRILPHSSARSTWTFCETFYGPSRASVPSAATGWLGWAPARWHHRPGAAFNPFDPLSISNHPVLNNKSHTRHYVVYFVMLMNSIVCFGDFLFLVWSGVLEERVVIR